MSEYSPIFWRMKALEAPDKIMHRARNLIDEKAPRSWHDALSLLVEAKILIGQRIKNGEAVLLPAYHALYEHIANKFLDNVESIAFPEEIEGRGKLALKAWGVRVHALALEVVKKGKDWEKRNPFLEDLRKQAWFITLADHLYGRRITILFPEEEEIPRVLEEKYEKEDYLDWKVWSRTAGFDQDDRYIEARERIKSRLRIMMDRRKADEPVCYNTMACLDPDAFIEQASETVWEPMKAFASPHHARSLREGKVVPVHGGSGHNPLMGLFPGNDNKKEFFQGLWAWPKSASGSLLGFLGDFLAELMDLKDHGDRVTNEKLIIEVLISIAYLAKVSGITEPVRLTYKGGEVPPQPRVFVLTDALQVITRNFPALPGEETIYTLKVNILGHSRNPSDFRWESSGFGYTTPNSNASVRYVHMKNGRGDDKEQKHLDPGTSHHFPREGIHEFGYGRGAISCLGHWNVSCLTSFKAKGSSTRKRYEELPDMPWILLNDLYHCEILCGGGELKINPL